MAAAGIDANAQHFQFPPALPAGTDLMMGGLGQSMFYWPQQGDKNALKISFCQASTCPPHCRPSTLPHRPSLPHQRQQRQQPQAAQQLMVATAYNNNSKMFPSCAQMRRLALQQLDLLLLLLNISLLISITHNMNTQQLNCTT